MGLYNVGSSPSTITKATNWSATSYSSTVAIAMAADVDATAVKAAIENRGSADVYIGFGGTAPASTGVMLKLPAGYGWLEDAPSAAHLKIWIGGAISTIVIARWTA